VRSGGTGRKDAEMRKGQGRGDAETREIISFAVTISYPYPEGRVLRNVRPLRILLVEDHGVSAKMMRMVLAAEGHTVELAGDAVTALELSDRRAFDLLISDLGLPDGSGHDLMRQLRDRGHKFPGIALSGYGQAEDVQRSYEAGFAVHLTKPASREAVIEAIAAVAAGNTAANGTG